MLNNVALRRNGKALAPVARSKQEDCDMKRLEYRLGKDRHGAPLVTLDSPIGSGHDIYPANLGSLANALLEIADAAERLKLGRYEQSKSGVVELK
jgi:hypothetical protein